MTTILALLLNVGRARCRVCVQTRVNVTVNGSRKTGTVLKQGCLSLTFRLTYPPIVCSEMKTLWFLHALILEGPPEVAVVGHLARCSANVSRERALVDDVVRLSAAVTQSHALAGALALGEGSSLREKKKSYHCHFCGCQEGV